MYFHQNNLAVNLKSFLREEILIVLQYEIEEIFLTRIGNRTFSESGIKIRDMLWQIGEYLYDQSSYENSLKIVLGDYLYYLRYHFFNLWELFNTMKKQNSDIYQRFKQKEYDPIDLFFKVGFLCMLMMNKEIQKAIFIDKEYELFWYEFYQFMCQIELEFEKEQSAQLQNKISELIELKMFLVPTGFELKRIKGIQKSIGRPSIITSEILLKFARILEENRKEKKYTLKKMLEMAGENTLKPTTLRNWLRNYMSILPEKRKSIRDLTKDDIYHMWKKSQKAEKI